MGNPEFAVPSLKNIVDSHHEIITVISNPPKRSGRGKKLNETEIGLIAKTMDLPLLQPPKINDLNFLRYISAMKPDIFVVVAFKILSNKLLSIPKYGAINLHPSLLPKYRGAAPIQWALLNGDSQTAVTTISLSQRIDSGAILLQKSVDIKSEDNYGSLAGRLSNLGADLVVETLDGIESGKLIGTPQHETKVTLAPKIKSADLKIDWTKSAEQLHNQIRAFSPFPGAFTIFNGKRLKVYKSAISISESTGNAGEIALNNENQFIVNTGNGVLEILEIQLEGKQRMPIYEFLRGIKIDNQMKFGN